MSKWVLKKFSHDLVPFKLVLTHSALNKNPVFINTPTTITNVSNYAHIGSFIVGVVAYDPLSNQLVNDYSIIYPNFDSLANQQLKIDKQTGRLSLQKALFLTKSRIIFCFFINLKGIITLSNLIFTKKFQLIVVAKAPNGLSSNITLHFDLTSPAEGLFSSMAFDSSKSDNLVVLGKTKVLTDPVLKTSVKCSVFSQPLAEFDCGDLKYTLDYSTDAVNTTQFVIDTNSVNLIKTF